MNIIPNSFGYNPAAAGHWPIQINHTNPYAFPGTFPPAQGSLVSTPHQLQPWPTAAHLIRAPHLVSPGLAWDPRFSNPFIPKAASLPQPSSSTTSGPGTPANSGNSMLHHYSQPISLHPSIDAVQGCKPPQNTNPRPLQAYIHPHMYQHSSHTVENQQQQSPQQAVAPSSLTPNCAPAKPVLLANTSSSLMGPPPVRQAHIPPAAIASPKNSVPENVMHPSQLRDTMGLSTYNSIRSLMLRQQSTYVQQLFELHKLSQVQKLLMCELGISEEDRTAAAHPLPEDTPSQRVQLNPYPAVQTNLDSACTLVKGERSDRMLSLACTVSAQPHSSSFTRVPASRMPSSQDGFGCAARSSFNTAQKQEHLHRMVHCMLNLPKTMRQKIRDGSSKGNISWDIKESNQVWQAMHVGTLRGLSRPQPVVLMAPDVLLAACPAASVQPTVQQQKSGMDWRGDFGEVVEEGDKSQERVEKGSGQDRASPSKRVSDNLQEAWSNPASSGNVNNSVYAGTKRKWSVESEGLNGERSAMLKLERGSSGEEGGGSGGEIGNTSGRMGHEGGSSGEDGGSGGGEGKTSERAAQVGVSSGEEGGGSGGVSSQRRAKQPAPNPSAATDTAAVRKLKSSPASSNSREGKFHAQQIMSANTHCHVPSSSLKMGSQERNTAAPLPPFKLSHEGPLASYQLQALTRPPALTISAVDLQAAWYAKHVNSLLPNSNKLAQADHARGVSMQNARMLEVTAQAEGMTDERGRADATQQHESRSLPLFVGDRGCLENPLRLSAPSLTQKPLETSCVSGGVQAAGNRTTGAPAGEAAGQEARHHEPVRWWQDAALTFGDVALLEPSNRRQQQLRGGDALNIEGPARCAEQDAPSALRPGFNSFKKLQGARKARSKHGSNRIMAGSGRCGGAGGSAHHPGGEEASEGSGSESVAAEGARRSSGSKHITLSPGGRSHGIIMRTFSQGNYSPDEPYEGSAGRHSKGLGEFRSSRIQSAADILLSLATSSQG
ncbi:hypothetical protein CEUSTIGMA_g1020.t1 [Chlamydomonas eustigma]|uniref:Uncharacterized protein n=1 Tax=Chlamydomonas eustigma TaxID=1157962 RepID=A0A250WS98_9CHLO|nr:hypothetical protein CEUSTIGMA_g1020.t1 [Chlamydomonas eustigma]|eukprot:GAX73569.1 hypothetical protein CEUSTIGMA_g1020.t1 [Chlamydomonas eustigma]